MKKNITLIGMMGSGKTTTAKELSKILPEFKLVDIDDEIEKSSGKKISEIFLKYGEAHFRELETNKIKQFIQNDLQTIYDRIKAESHRPLLKKNFSVEKIANILSLREKNYQKANYTIETDKKTPQDIAKEIAGVINA